MHVVGILSILVQVVLVVHAIRTGQERYWIFILLFFPLVGSLVYAVIVLLPDLRTNHHAHKAGNAFKNVIDPDRNIRDHARNLERSDTVENKIRLAEELTHKGMLDEALNLYHEALTGVFKHEPHLMLAVAKILFKQGKYQETRTTLDSLIAENPDYKSQEGHLLYAMTLEKIGDNEAASHEYEVLCEYYSGFEAKCRYGLMLKAQGKTVRANELFSDILNEAKLGGRHVAKMNGEWISIAKKEISR